MGVRLCIILGDFGVAAIPLLISALRHECVGVRMHAAEALGRLGPGSHESISALHISLLDEDGPPTDENSVAGIAAWALDQIRGGPGSKVAFEADRLASVIRIRQNPVQ
jgi:hypothetical protein